MDQGSCGAVRNEEVMERGRGRLTTDDSVVRRIDMYKMSK
jgi:hypothetical protein